MSNDTRDYQRAKVYRWEHSEWWWADHIRTPGKEPVLSLLEMERLAKEITGVHCRVKDGRGRRNAGGSYDSRTIWMPRWARTMPVLCHELAHAHSPPTDGGWHGPWFVAKYCLFLQRAGVVGSARVTRMSAIDAGLDVANLRWV